MVMQQIAATASHSGSCGCASHAQGVNILGRTTSGSFVATGRFAPGETMEFKASPPSIQLRRTATVRASPGFIATRFQMTVGVLSDSYNWIVPEALGRYDVLVQSTPSFFGMPTWSTNDEHLSFEVVEKVPARAPGEPGFIDRAIRLPEDLGKSLGAGLLMPALVIGALLLVWGKSGSPGKRFVG